MATLSDARKLAKELAAAAAGLRDTHAAAAQTYVYRLLLDQWDTGTNALKHVQLSSIMLDSIAAILQSDTAEQAREYYRKQGKDASVYFHQEFIRAFDTDYSSKRGVHYSPPEVVSYIVRSAADLLEKKHNTAIDDVVLLDPCCGIGTFPHFIETHTDFHPQMIGLELNPATCSLARCLLRHCNVIQTDSLEEIELPVNDRPLVVIGNPPYSGHSANSGSIVDLLADYRAGLNERNPKWLQDDYVKFIRMAQHRVDQASRGIVAFVTNHSFIFNPTFRAMRASLIRSFDEIYILDLHGNSKKIETTNGEPDENVFPIQMGVAISFMVKHSDEPGCKVYYSELRGKRETKLKTLAELTFDNTPWTSINAGVPHFSFTFQDTNLQNEFYSFPSITNFFGAASVGFVTSRDAFAIDSDRNALMNRIAALRDGTVSDDILRNDMGAGDLDIERARRELRDDPNWQEKLIEVLYRPFDRRWAYYSRITMERPRLPFMENLMRDNVALAVGRAGHATGSDTWDVVFCTDRPADLNLFRRGGALLLPRWTYAGDDRMSNINGDTDHDLLFAYIYALLHSNIYRKRYADLLSVDFPRIPLPQDNVTLSRLAETGSKLIDIHLMRSQGDKLNANAAMTIGGYQMPQKYRNDRRNRKLSAQEQKWFDTIATAVSATLVLQDEIDVVISESPPW